MILTQSTCMCFCSSLDLTGPLMLGGLLQVPVDFPVPYQHFIGCIRNVYIDHKFLDLSRPLYKNGTSEKCKAMGDTCSYKPCQRGKCTNILGTRQCACPSGYGGSRCESGNGEEHWLNNQLQVTMLSRWKSDTLNWAINIHLTLH